MFHGWLAVLADVVEVSKRFDTKRVVVGDLSSLAVADPIEKKGIFSCPMRVQNQCVGPECVREWNRSENDRNLHVFYYSEKRVVEKGRGLLKKRPINSYHIVKKVFQQEAFCNLYRKKVWALISEEGIDLFYEEGSDEPDFDYILKPLLEEADADKR